MSRRGADTAQARAQRRRIAGRVPAGTDRFLRKVPAYDMVDGAMVDAIHAASLRIVEEIGIDFREAQALEEWRAAGARIDGQRVRIPGALLMDLVAQAPAEYVQHARNPARSIRIGGRHMAFAPVYGSPYVRDLEGERRYARLEDFHNFVRLAQVSAALNMSGGTLCEPTDVPVPKRHLDMLLAHMRFADKPFMGAVTAESRARDSVDMCGILFGDEFVRHNTVMTSLINCNSPLVWDASMITVMRVYAANNQACLISPFIMQGANTPTTAAGAMAQLNAEGLAGVAYTQLVRPGAPVVYGATLSTVSMQSGAPMYGTTETQLLMFLTAQLARRYRIPMRTGGMRNGSKCCDGQAAFESVQTMLPAMLAGGNLFLHSAGWLESGLSACFAKFMMDVDQLTILQRMMGGVEVTEDSLAFDAIASVGPGGHFFGSEHTLRHYENAFFVPETPDNNTYEQWIEEGGKDMRDRARALAARKLQDYEQPPLDPEIEARLLAFVAKRKAELPDDVR